MSEKTDVLVIGGGVVGVCAAYYLAGRGCRVTLIEQGEIASGCSYANAGLIVPSHATPLPQPGALASGLKWLLDPKSPFYIKPRLDFDLLRWLITFAAHCTERHVRYALPVLRDLGLASAALYDELAALFDFGYTHHGLILAYKTKAALGHGLAEAELLNANGLSAVPLSPAEAHETEPTLRSDLAGGIFYKADSHLNPAMFVTGLAKCLQGKGRVAIQRNTKVKGLVKSGRRIECVETTAGDFRPAEVVVAAGAWSPALTRSLDLNVPIQAAKGYSVTVKRPLIYPRHGLLLGESRVAVTPMLSPEGDILRFAGTLELTGLDLSINQRRAEAVRRAPKDYMIGLEGALLETMEVWSGLRPCTPDGLPIIGRPASLDNLTLAAGHAMVGMSLGPITGKLVAQIVCGEKTDVDVRPLRAERF
ncbi:MAG TPA: FAD-dependent oxidoreductase [Anaerolineales bacterium]|nr:FAD-dependent oxidoreductase [Anaerolineales bacterium]